MMTTFERVQEMRTDEKAREMKAHLAAARAAAAPPEPEAPRVVPQHSGSGGGGRRKKDLADIYLGRYSGPARN